jgi:hypothetical protein
MRAPIAFITALILPLAGCGGVSYPTADGGVDQGEHHDMGLVDRGPEVNKTDGPPADNGSPGDLVHKDSWSPMDGPPIWPDTAILDGPPYYPDAYWPYADTTPPYADAAGPTYPDASAPYPDF